MKPWEMSPMFDIFVDVSVCTCSCVGDMYGDTGAHSCMCVSMRRPEDNLKCHPSGGFYPA